MSMLPIRYDDPFYAQLARQTEPMYNLPTGILDAIRTMGERTNANQISPAGARGVYQFTPPTRQGFIKNYGVDPWASPEEATKAAALHLAESYKRTGSWDKAIAGYHGGIKAERGVRGPVNRAYTKRVGSFDDPPEPYYNRDKTSDYGYGGYGGLPKNANMEDVVAQYVNTEPPKETAPVLLGDPGPSVSVPAAAPQTAKKRGGILGALESVFMPDPDSLWAGALRSGLVNAKESQAAYRAGVQKQNIDMQEANVRLKNLIRGGEYKIAGNNLIHHKPDGTAEIIQAPVTKGEKERLLDAWRAEGDPTVKNLIEGMLLGGNDPDVLAARAAAAAETARIRAGATTGAARIRANAPSKAKSAKAPPAGFIVD